MSEECEFHGDDQEACEAYSGKFPCSENLDVVDEDWLSGVSCNPDAPEECESCQ